MKTRTHITALALALATGCSEDVQLGVAFGGPADASVGDGGFVAGNYTLFFFDTVSSLCNGTLAGSESAFNGQSVPALGLVDTSVTVTLLSDELVRISGAALDSPFKRTVLDLARTSIGSGGVYEWFGSVDDDFGAGPMATTQVQRTLKFSEPIENPPMATTTVRYETAAQTSSCELFVSAVLIP